MNQFSRSLMARGVSVAVGVFAAACHQPAAPATVDTANTCQDSGATNFGSTPPCQYPPDFRVTIPSWAYRRGVAVDPRLTPPPRYGMASWVVDDDNSSYCGGTEWIKNGGSLWDVSTQTFTCSSMTLTPGVVHKVFVNDLARNDGPLASIAVCDVVSANGQVLAPTSESPAEYCFLVVDSRGHITSTDGLGTRIGPR